MKPFLRPNGLTPAQAASVDALHKGAVKAYLRKYRPVQYALMHIETVRKGPSA